MQNVIKLLEERGFIEAVTSEELVDQVDQPLHVYCGFDPTGESLHLGSLVAIMGLAWFKRCGHHPVALVGGATGMIGDPSGKKQERQLLDEETINRNLCGIRKNLEAVLGSDVKVLNNFDWFKDFGWIEFLRDIGKHFRVGPMLAKESVRARLDSEEGMSFTEFSYQLLQAYDFLYLYDQHQVTVQIGGSDQWGNITAGKELVRKLRSTSVHGVTFPLLTTSTGQKFGKTEQGAVWLSPDKCSPYAFYQYLYRLPDADVGKLLRLLTFLEMDEIRKIESEMAANPNAAQKRLAEEVTRIVHGEEGLETALKVTEGAKPGAETELNVETLEALASDMPSHTLLRSEIIESKLIDLVTNIEIVKSKGDARRLIRNGGVSINNEKVSDENFVIQSEHLIDQKLMLLALGKKNKILIRVKKIEDA